MKKLFFAGVAAIALAASPASGADLPRKPIYKAPPPVVAPVPFSWTGFYVGVNAGGAWGHDDERLVLTGSWLGTPEVPGLQAAGSQGMNPSGFTGGGQAGYNLQAGPAVVGIEADLNYLGVRADRFIPNVPVAGNNSYAFDASDRTKWMATVRGRLGYAQDRLLVYFTGRLPGAGRQLSQA